MSATALTKTRLQTQTAGDPNWSVGLDAGITSFEARWRFRGTSAPANPFVGMTWIDNTTSPLEVHKIYDGTATWAIYGYHDLTADLWYPAIAGLAAETTVDEAADYFAMMDASEGTNFVNKVLAKYVSPVGTQTIPIIAAAMKSRTSNGCAPLAWAETSTNKVMEGTLDFDPAAQEFAQVRIPMPKGYNLGTVLVSFIWRAAATGNVVWGCQAAAFSDDDSADGTAFGTGVNVVDGVTATTDIMISAYTTAITIAGSPASEDYVVLQVYRDGASGSDTCTSDARLLGIRVKYTRSVATDV